jgi:hypothetical protein
MITEIDYDHDIWKYYPAFIEYFIQFLKFMDHLFNNLVNIIGEKPSKMDSLKTSNFIDLLTLFPIHGSFIQLERDNKTYLLLNH